MRSSETHSGCVENRTTLPEGAAENAWRYSSCRAEGMQEKLPPKKQTSTGSFREERDCATSDGFGATTCPVILFWSQ